MTAGLFALVGAIACTGGGTSVDTAPDTAADSGDSAAPGDSSDSGGSGDDDGDGFTISSGDCDDTDAAVHPGAQEESGDGTDADCDGSDYGSVPVSAFAQKLAGSAQAMTFGAVVVLDPAASVPGAALVAETGDLAGQLGGDGAVHIFSAAEAAAGSPAGTQLHHNEPGASFGKAVGVARLSDGTRSWLAGFSDISDFGGFCAWDDGAAGTVTTDAARACIPPFAENINDRAFGGFAGSADLDGDDSNDLVTAGFSGISGSQTGAIWVTLGPVDYAGLALEPSRGLAGFASVPSPTVAGDFDLDGYEDLILADSGAEGSTGAVYIYSGGAGLLDSFDALDGVDGDRAESDAGRSVTTLDLNGDLSPDLCVSASRDDTAGERAGRVACFYGPLTGRMSMSDAAVAWVAEQPNSFFGFAIGALDTDGDGDDEVAVGAPDDPYFGHGWPGKLYLYDPTSHIPLGLLVGTRGDGLGAALGTGDLDGDGRDDLVVGAPWSDGLTGAAYTVFASGGAW